MSFDIFISAFENGGLRRYPRAILEKAFRGFTDMSDPESWRLSNSFATIYIDADDQVSGFGVNRPPSNDHPFWPALLSVLQETSSVLYWPGGGPVVTDQSVAASIPEKMIEALGPAKVATSIQDISRFIRES